MAANGNAPHDVGFYLRELAASYHSYYDAERIWWMTNVSSVRAHAGGGHCPGTGHRPVDAGRVGAQRM